MDLARDEWHTVAELQIECPLGSHPLFEL
jgi:hypothetical protein